MANEGGESTAARKQLIRKITDDLKNRAGEYEAIKNPLGTSSDVWNAGNFLIIRKKGSATYEDFAICVKCTEIRSYKLGNSPSNLRRHLKKCTGTGTELAQNPLPVPPLPDFIPVPNQVKTDFKNTTVDFCVRDLRPFNVVAGTGFEALIQKAIDVGATQGRVNAADLLSDPTTLSRGLSERAEHARQEVSPKIAELIRSGLCAGTTDMWTDGFTQNHYLTVTIHFIDNDEGSGDWHFKSLILFTSKFPYESATGDNIKEEIISQFLKLSLDKDDYLKVKWTSDGGSNIIKALQDCDRTGCMAHALNVVLKNLFTFKLKEVDLFGAEGGRVVNAAEDVTKYVKQNKLDLTFPTTLREFPKPSITQYRSKMPALESLYEHFDEVHDRLQDEGVDIMDSLIKEDLKDLIDVVTKIEEAISSGKKLTAETMHRLIDVLNENEAEEGSSFRRNLCNHLKEETSILATLELIEHCKLLVAYIKRSGLNSRLDQTLKQEIDTRWNSLLRMLRSVHTSYDQVTEILTQRKEENRLNGIYKEKLLELIKFLEPFDVETSRIEGDSGPNLAYVLLIHARLRKHCEAKEDDTPMTANLKARGRALIDAKIKPQLNQNHKLATFLHPQFKGLRMLSECERNHVYFLASQKCDAFDLGSRNSSTEEESLESDSPPEKRRKHNDDDFSEWMDPADEMPFDEVQLYLRDVSASSVSKGSKDLLKYWKSKEMDLPKLSRLARQILCVQPTSAPSERVFSLAGIVINARRTRLHQENVNNILFLNSYLKLGNN